MSQKNGAIKHKHDNDDTHKIKRCKNNTSLKRKHDNDEPDFVKRKPDNIQDICTIFSQKTLKYDGSAVIYSRVSTGKQVFGTSLSSQQMICKEYCTKKNFKIIKEYSESVSAKNISKQTELNKIVEENYDIQLVVLDASRLTRNMTDFINFLNKCKQKQIVIHFAQDNLESSNMHDIKKMISNVIDSETELKNLSERIIRSIQHRKQTGTYFPTKIQYGYMLKELKNSKFKKIICPNDNEKKIIKLIKEMRSGVSLMMLDDSIEKITGIKEYMKSYFPSNYLNDDEFNYTMSDEKYVFNLKEIAFHLNNMKITNRNKIWNNRMISHIVKHNV